MDEREFWRLVAEYLMSLQTSGNQANPGGDMPYDDYGLQDTIGGIGMTDGNRYPFEDWSDTGIAGSGYEPAMAPVMMDIGGYPLVRPSVMPRSGSDPEQVARVDAMMTALADGEAARSAAPLTGLFGGPADPTVTRPMAPRTQPRDRSGAQRVVRSLSQPTGGRGPAQLPSWAKQPAATPRLANSQVNPVRRPVSSTPVRTQPAPARGFAKGPNPRAAMANPVPQGRFTSPMPRAGAPTATNAVRNVTKGFRP